MGLLCLPLKKEEKESFNSECKKWRNVSNEKKKEKKEENQPTCPVILKTINTFLFGTFFGVVFEILYSPVPVDGKLLFHFGPCHLGNCVIRLSNMAEARMTNRQDAISTTFSNCPILADISFFYNCHFYFCFTRTFMAFT